MKGQTAVIPVLMLLHGIAFRCHAEQPPACPRSEVEAHVLEQLRIYGPLSRDREYFGFVYRSDGVIGSAVTRGGVCRRMQPCEVKSRRAASRIPTGAKVLGEWHTHPRSTGSLQLSAADVRGAHANRHIRCYRAFFSTANGEILSWDPDAVVVATAMMKAVSLGTYRRSP
jgi:hypothetical protein